MEPQTPGRQRGPKICYVLNTCFPILGSQTSFFKQKKFALNKSCIFAFRKEIVLGSFGTCLKVFRNRNIVISLSPPVCIQYTLLRHFSVTVVCDMYKVNDLVVSDLQVTQAAWADCVWANLQRYSGFHFHSHYLTVYPRGQNKSIFLGGP